MCLFVQINFYVCERCMCVLCVCVLCVHICICVHSRCVYCALCVVLLVCMYVHTCVVCAHCVCVCVCVPFPCWFGLEEKGTVTLPVIFMILQTLPLSKARVSASCPRNSPLILDVWDAPLPMFPHIRPTLERPPNLYCSPGNHLLTKHLPFEHQNMNLLKFRDIGPQ